MNQQFNHNIRTENDVPTIYKRIRLVIQAAGVVFRKKVLGVEHPHTLASSSNPGSLLDSLDRSLSPGPDMPAQCSSRV